nr:MAG TPA: hypothetical protein [Bacteriophage sp.]
MSKKTTAFYPLKSLPDDLNRSALFQRTFCPIFLISHP